MTGNTDAEWVGNVNCFCKYKNELHPAARKLKEREILLEHEEVNVMPVILLQQGPDQGENVLTHAGFAAMDDTGGNGNFHARAD